MMVQDDILTTKGKPPIKSKPKILFSGWSSKLIDPLNKQLGTELLRDIVLDGRNPKTRQSSSPITRELQQAHTLTKVHQYIFRIQKLQTSPDKCTTPESCNNEGVACSNLIQPSCKLRQTNTPSQNAYRGVSESWIRNERQRSFETCFIVQFLFQDWCLAFSSDLEVLDFIWHVGDLRLNLDVSYNLHIWRRYWA